MALDPAVAQLAESVLADRRHLHAHPERSFQERDTVRYVAARAQALGLAAESAGGGLVVRLRGAAGDGPTVAVRADMDALPIEEAVDLPFRSQNPGVMHACGHDAHVAMALGLLAVLGARPERLRGEVRVIFQPAEETPPGGALAMIDEGALDGVDMLLGIHLSSDLEAGRVDLRPGTATANSDTFAITVRGRGGHASEPDLCVDAALAAAQVLVALQTIVSRRVAPLEPVVVTVGEIHAGTAANVIPALARLNGTVRTFSDSARRTVRGELARIAGAVAEAAGASAEVEYLEGYPCVQNAEGEPTTGLIEAARAVVGADHVVGRPPIMAGDDFAHYLARVPGAFLFLGCGGPGFAPHHSPLFRVDEACLPLGVDILARAARRLTGSDA